MSPMSVGGAKADLLGMYGFDKAADRRPDALEEIRSGGESPDVAISIHRRPWRGFEGRSPPGQRLGKVMPSETRSPRLAVLIDADNASAKIADGLFEEIAKIGEASVRRIYGDFSNARSKGWADILSKHAIIPQQQFAYTTGKNASDITLVIDAMDLLHGGRFDGFCLVSSDSDFTRLAARIREHGVDVFGFGEQKTPESFRQACRRFVYTENLLGGAANSQDAASRSQPLQPPDAATPIIKKVIAQMESEDGWVALGEVGKAAHQPGARFRFEDLRLPQAERSRAKDKRFRDRAAQGRNHANSDQACCRIASEDANRSKTCGVRTSPTASSPSLPAWQRSAFGTRRPVG